MLLNKRVGVRLAALAFAAVVLWVVKPTTMLGHEGPRPRKIVKVKGKPALDGDVLVKFRRKLKEHEHKQIQYQVDADSSDDVGSAGVRLLHSRSYDTETLLRYLETHPDVAYVEPNYVIQTAALPNDANFGQLWGLLNPRAAGADIGATAAWDVSTGSGDTVIGVVDSGIDYNHPDLAANVWSAPQPFTVQIGWQTITCAAGTHGFNAINNTCDPMDDNSHGTHISGTIGAVGNNGIGVTGVNWNASLMALKFLDANGLGSTANAINAIEFVIQAKAATGANVRVLNNSWGGGNWSSALLDEINKAADNNILIVAAAGNNGRSTDSSPFYPASYNASNVVSVSATDNYDGLAWFSNYGSSTVDLGAPGVDILSTVINGGYASGTGTSMAAPHVAGAAALLLSRCALDTPGLKAALLNSVDSLAALTGVTSSGGRLNVNKAIRRCVGSRADFSLATDSSARTVAVSASTSYAVTVTPVAGFSGHVAFTVSGLPAGATAAFSPATVTGSGVMTMTVSAASTAAAGVYPLTITATSGSLVHTVAVMLSVISQPPTFSLSAGPSSQTITQGMGGSYLVTITPSGGFAGLVSLSASGLPSGATVSFSPSTLSGSGSTNMMVTTSLFTPAGTSTVTITASSGTLTRTAPVTLVVATRKGDFKVDSLVQTQAIGRGSDGTFYIAITPTNGFVGTVNLSANDQPYGATVTFTPASLTVTGTSQLIAVMTVDVADGRRYNYNIHVTGTSGSISHSTDVQLQVR